MTALSNPKKESTQTGIPSETKKKKEKKKEKENAGGSQNNQRSKQMVNDVARELGINRRDFGRFVEREKAYRLAPGTDWTYQQLEDLGRKFQDSNSGRRRRR